MPKRTQLTEHFNVAEFDCNDGTPVPKEYEPELRILCTVFLEPMRKKFGPCTVLSGFRTDSWNAHVGGARFSFHKYLIRRPSEGVAADVRFKNGTPKKWARTARWRRLRRRGGKGGVGYYPNSGFVHVDTRDYKSDWEG